MSYSADELVTVAYTVRTRGLRGELVADILTDFPERFDALEDVTVVTKSGEQAALKIEDVWFQKDRAVIKFAGVNSIEAAEPYINAKVCIHEDEAVVLEEGEFYDWQLEGCRVEMPDGSLLGQVRELMRTGGTEILVVAREDDPKKDYLIPFAESICRNVDIENKLITIDPPEGLLDL